LSAELAGRTVLITGVGRVGQIGHAVARAFGRAGARLVVADVSAPAVAERARELSAQGYPVRDVAGDLATADVARRAVAVAQDTWGALDALVNVAGGLLYYGPASSLTAEQFDRELTVNVKTTWCMCQAALPALIARRGAIVNFASVAVLRPEPQMASYIAAKAAVAGLTRALAREYADQGVRVNAVAPGTMRTADNVAQLGAGAHLVALEALVDTVLFLAGPGGSGISGEILAVTGGTG